MKAKNNLLDIFVNGVDKQKDLGYFGTNYTKTLTTTDYIEIGYKKKINQFFIELKTPNTTDISLVLQKWNGTSWVSLTHFDETKGLKQSGFIFIDESEDLTEHNLNGKTQIWIRLKVSASTSAVIFNGINIVLCNLQDLISKVPHVEQFYPRGISSHIYSIKEATEYVIERINNSNPFDNYVYQYHLGAVIDVRLLNAFDIFDINELRRPVANYALFLIYRNLSDSSDDNYQQKSQQFLEEFEKDFKLFKNRKITLDLDDDGKESDSEKVSSTRSIRLIR